jgi:peptide/nickel transport system substrate-binding protein
LEVELLTQSSFPYYDIAQHIQQNGSKIGVKFKISSMVGKHLYSKLRAQKFEMSLSGYSFNEPDANNVMLRHAYNRSAEGKKNTVSVAWRSSWDPGDEFNDNILKAQIEKDPDLRRQMYEQMQLRHVEESPLIYLFERINVRALSRNVREIHCNATTICYDSVRKLVPEVEQ